MRYFRLIGFIFVLILLFKPDVLGQIFIGKIIKDYDEIKAAELLKLINQKDDFLLIDNRTQREYDEGHIPGAILVPVDSLTFDKTSPVGEMIQKIREKENSHVRFILKDSSVREQYISAELLKTFLNSLPKDKEKLLVLYDRKTSCTRSSTFAHWIEILGYRNVKRYVPGWAGWQKEGNPTQAHEQSEDLAKFLEETSHLDFSHPVFAETLAKVVTSEMTTEEKLEKLFYFTRDTIPFIPSASLTASGALEQMKAICYTKAMIYVSFCRKLGVPAVLATIQFYYFNRPKTRKIYHGIARVFANGKWIYVDTVSNRESWKLWDFKEYATFNPPKFSLKNNVMVSSDYYQDITFEDYVTNDVPEAWLESMEEFIKTGKW